MPNLVELAEQPEAAVLHRRRHRLWRAAQAYVDARVRDADQWERLCRLSRGRLGATDVQEAYVAAARRTFEQLLEEERKLLVRLLRLLPEAMQAGDGGRDDWIGSGPDSKCLTYGPLWYEAAPMWEELIRCLDLLRVEQPTLYAHLNSRYDFAGDGLVRLARRRVRFSKRPDGTLGYPRSLDANETILVQGPATASLYVLDCLVETWPRWVRQGDVRSALDYLLARIDVDLYIPDSVAQAA